MNKRTKEWFKQADYDLGTAKIMLKGRRYIYTVFMCHLTLEKALKGIYCQIIKDNPPRVHNLVFLVTKIGLKLPEPLEKFINWLNNLSVTTRYPNELSRLLDAYTLKRATGILKKTEEVLKWLKTELSKQSKS
jgi:HEPN domain-containing protein